MIDDLIGWLLQLVPWQVWLMLLTVLAAVVVLVLVS